MKRFEVLEIFEGLFFGVTFAHVDFVLVKPSGGNYMCTGWPTMRFDHKHHKHCFQSETSIFISFEFEFCIEF